MNMVWWKNIQSAHQFVFKRIKREISNAGRRDEMTVPWISIPPLLTVLNVYVMVCLQC